MEQWRPIPPPAPAASPATVVPVWAAERWKHVVDTVRWFGWGRVLAVVIGVPLVGWGAYVLVRSPEPPVEASLAYVTTVPAGDAPSSASPASGTSDAATASTITVHVAGPVTSPGVYRLAAGSRVVDAVRAAGGATTSAELDSVNLASLVEDGQQIYVPTFGERPPGGASSTSPSAGVRLPVDLNRATAEELDQLPGIGPTTAAAIVAHREEYGPFATTEGLLAVPGIGPAKLAALSGLITVR
ncbi:MAG: helix-hairpin-helix domain-containing protein [Ilumatobacteraceae bacterium]